MKKSILTTCPNFGGHHNEILGALEHNKCDTNSKNNLQLLQANIQVARSDHFLSIEGSQQLASIIGLSRQLESNLNFKPYSLLIKKKCDFLKDKLLLRIRHEMKPKPAFMVINGQEKQISINDFKDGIFDELLGYIDSHYEMNDDWKNNISSDYELLRNKRIQDCTARELHRLIKYHKDVDRSFPSSIDMLNKIRREFQNRLNEALGNGNIFDIYSYRIAVNYSINNEFSLTSEDPTTSIEKAESLYNEIISIQKETGIKNFFPQTKFLIFLLGKLKEIYNQRKALGFVQPCRDIINKCHNIYARYKENVDWSKSNYTYVFQLYQS